MKKWELHRRTVLKGMGASLALPLLDAMMPSVAKAAVGRPNLLMMCFTNGIYTGRYPFDTGPEYGAWSPGQFGKLPTQLPIILDPLTRHKDYISVLTGISNPASAGHVAPATYLTCQYPENTKTLSPRDSMDQIIANEIANSSSKTPFRSIATAPWHLDWAVDDWYAGYATNISYWNRRFVDRNSNPLLLYDLLFKNFTQPAPSPMVRSEFNQSVLDFTKEGLTSLMRPGRLGAEDRNRMQQYMDSVRDLERSLASLPPTQMAVNSCQLPLRGGQDVVPIDSHEDGTYGKRAEALLSLIVHAFACDLTSVGTFLWDEEGSYRTLRNVIPPSNFMNTVMDGQCHADMAHYPGVNGIDNPPELMRHNRNQLISANRYYSSVVANVLDKMKSFITPEGNLLDKSMVSYGYGLADANNHSSQNLALVLAGRGGGLQPGNHYDFRNKNLQAHHLTLMRKMGSNVASFAGTSETLGF